MSDDEKNTVKALFAVDRAKAGRANCKGCKQKCLQGELRLAKVVPSPYGDGNTMKSWHHVDCFMNVLLKQRPTTKRIDSIQDIENFSNLSVEDKQTIIDKINEMEKDYAQKHNNKFPQRVLAVIDVNENQSKQFNSKNVPSSSKDVPSSSKNVPSSSKNVLKVTAINIDLDHKDNYFKQFRKLCVDISNEDAYTAKTAVVNNFFTNGSDGNGFKSDVILWCRFLLPQAVKRVYNLKSKQLIKLFARIFHADHDDMLTDLENGDVAETIRIFFEKSRHCTPSKKSLLKIQEVDAFLEKLSELTKEDEQIYHFKGVVKQCTSNDLKMIIRLINGDLRINSGPKHILEGIHPDAYKVFQTSRDIDSVIDRVLSGTNIVKGTTDSQKSTFKAKLVLMTPILPMLAQACKSVDMAMKKCPNGMYSEIKYDGERVQVHKKGLDFKYFSRALKPVLPHKVSRFKDFIPKAFPHGQDLILDAEVLMIDTQTGKPLPFGSLGKHKKAEFEFAEVCLFVFDCIYFNGEVLLDKPIRERREILQKNMIEIENHIMFSEMKHIEKPSDLANMIAKVLKLGLEGLVLKDLESTYEPGKRHWLKVKKDYLFGGAMADSADLVVLGAWFGTGKKGGLLSVFLMGCYDEHRDKWLTVTKVHTGHDDKSLEELQEPLKGLMEKISQDSNKVPAWMNCTNVMVPDFIAKNPRKMPVWEITGTELTKANLHTADGLSVRFPRVTRIRDDKDWKTATNLSELKLLYKTSKENVDVSLLNNLANKAEDVEQLAKIDLKEIDPSKKASPSKANSVRKDKIENDFNKNDTNVDSKHTKHDRDINIDKKYNEDNNISCNNWSPTDSKTKLGKRIAQSDSLDGSPKKCKDIAKSGVKQDSGPLHPLPDYFVGYNLAFHQEDSAYRKSEKVRTAIRYWIAFGGKVINHGDNVTHVIHFDSNLSFRDFNEIQTKYSFGARHVNLKWLTESIKRRCLCDTRQYAITLDS